MKFCLSFFFVGVVLLAGAEVSFPNSTVQVLVMDPVGGKGQSFINYLSLNRKERFVEVIEKVNKLFGVPGTVGFALYDNAGANGCMMELKPLNTTETTSIAYSNITAKSVSKSVDGSFQGSIIAMTDKSIVWDGEKTDKDVVKVILIAAESKPKDPPTSASNPMKADGKDTCTMDAPSVEFFADILRQKKIAVVAAVTKEAKSDWEKYIEVFPFASSVIELEYPNAASLPSDDMKSAISKYAAAVSDAVQKIATAHQPVTTISTVKASSAARYSAALATAVFLGCQAL